MPYVYPGEEFPQIPDVPSCASSLANLPDLLAWHQHLCDATSKFDGAVAEHDAAVAAHAAAVKRAKLLVGLASDKIKDTDIRRRLAWNRLAGLRGGVEWNDVLIDIARPSEVPSRPDKGKGRAPPISVQDDSGSGRASDGDPTGDSGDFDEDEVFERASDAGSGEGGAMDVS
jgi:hypothetical protein